MRVYLSHRYGHGIKQGIAKAWKQATGLGRSHNLLSRRGAEGVSATCQKGRHAACVKLKCSCPCGHGWV
jgi:hypothetical protein